MGTNVGSAVTATDADSDTLEYTLEGTDAASFAIVSTFDRRQIQTKTGVTYNHEGTWAPPALGETVTSKAGRRQRGDGAHAYNGVTITSLRTWTRTRRRRTVIWERPDVQPTDGLGDDGHSLGSTDWKEPADDTG